jgi:uncharacterized protein YndB with AHSA1/START domain
MPATGKSAADATAATTNRPELTITRTFDAPRELVYRLFTEPAHLQRWMGPRGFTAMHFTQDARVGGKWRAMLRPDDGGRDLWQGGVFREISPPKRVSYTFAWDQDDNGDPGNEMLVTLDFTDLGDKTRLTFRQTGFDSDGQRDGHRGGWNSSFDRFEEYLATVSAPHKQ